MRKFLGASAAVVALAGAFVACGSKSKEPPKDPMAEMTPEQRQAAQQRSAQDDQRERQLAASREPQSTSGQPGSAIRTSTALATSSIATARCDRELKCKNIGTNKTYLSTDECVTKMQNEKRADLNPDECPKGVSDNDLATCLKAIRDEDCGNPIDSTSRMHQCRASALCMK